MSNKNFRYQHIYSAVENKAPSADTLYVGEIAVNGNAEKPQLFIKDSSGNVRSFYSDYVVNLSQAEYDALVSAGTVDERILYNITDADPIDVSGYVSSGSVDTTASTSAYTLSFSGDNGSLFSLEVPKGGDGKKMIAGDNISIVSGETADTISVSGASAITSSSTEVVQSKAIYEELDKKLDKVNFINNLYPKGSVYITYEYKNPSTFIGGEWELIGGEDADKNYYPAFAIDTDTAGTTINESLPNITGNINTRGFANTDNQVIYPHSGAFSWAGAGSSADVMAQPTTGGNMRLMNFNANKSSSIYQDGAHVNVNAIKLFHWRRTDDGTIVEQITPLDVDVKDVLWEGTSATEASVSLPMAKSLFDYKEISIITTNSNDWNQNTQAKSLTIDDYNRIVDAGGTPLISYDWDGTSRFVNGIQYLDDGMTFKAWVSGCKIRKIIGLRAIPTTDIPYNVEEVLWTGSTGTGGAKTLSNNINNFDYLKFYTSNNPADNNVMVDKVDVKDINSSLPGARIIIENGWDSTLRYCRMYKLSDTSLNIELTSETLLKITGVRTTAKAEISAGNGIEINNGVISVEHPTNVIEVTGKLDGNGYLYDVGGVSGAKVRLPKNAIMTGVNVKTLSDHTVGAGYQIIFFQYYYPSENFSQWCFRLLNWDDSKLGAKTNVVADISYILA